MAATAFATCGEYVSALSQHHLVGPEDETKIAEFLRSGPLAGPRELAGFLVRNGILTKRQAEFLVEGRAAELVLGPYTLVDEIGVGTMGAVYKARSSKGDGWYAIKTVPRRNVMNLT